MDTLFIIRDSITAHVVKVVDTCQPCIQETETNCNDVEIVKSMCLAVVVIVLIIAITIVIVACHNYSKNKKCDDLERRITELRKQSDNANTKNG